MSKEGRTQLVEGGWRKRGEMEAGGGGGGGGGRKKGRGRAGTSGRSEGRETYKTEIALECKVEVQGETAAVQFSFVKIVTFRFYTTLKCSTHISVGWRCDYSINRQLILKI